MANACVLNEYCVPAGNAVITMPAGTIKRIHVNQHIIKQNKNTGTSMPPLTIKWRNKTYPASDVSVNGESKVVYAPLCPLSCGAHVWIETKSEVVAVV